jgi:hypothetical protein
MRYPTLAHFRHFRHSFNYNIFPDTLILQNKPNFPHFSPENDDFTEKQTQFKPKQSQFKPKQTQFKPNSNPIFRKGKNESFCVDKEPYDCFNNTTREFYHPYKGVNFKRGRQLIN